MWSKKIKSRMATHVFLSVSRENVSGVKGFIMKTRWLTHQSWSKLLVLLLAGLGLAMAIPCPSVNAEFYHAGSIDVQIVTTEQYVSDFDQDFHSGDAVQGNIGVALSEHYAHATGGYRADLAVGELGTSANSTIFPIGIPDLSDYASAEAYAGFSDTVYTTMSAGFYADGAFAELAFSIEAELSGWYAYVDWNFSAASALGAPDPFYGDYAVYDTGYSGYAYDAQATLSVPLVAPGTFLSTDQDVAFTLHGFMLSRAEVYMEGDSFADFYYTGRIESLTLPSDVWWSESGILGTDVDEFARVTTPANFTPVPIPGAVLLGMLGLGVAGLKLRKFA